MYCIWCSQHAKMTSYADYFTQSSIYTSMINHKTNKQGEKCSKVTKFAFAHKNGTQSHFQPHRGSPDGSNIGNFSNKNKYYNRFTASIPAPELLEANKTEKSRKEAKKIKTGRTLAGLLASTGAASFDPKLKEKNFHHNDKENRPLCPHRWAFSILYIHASEFWRYGS